MDTYEKKLALAKEALDSGYYDKETIEYIFPELKESEDERIRKSLIDMLKNDEKCYLKEIAWLEKQGSQILANPAKTCKDEQKPADITNKLKEEYQRGWDAAMLQLPKEVDSQIWQIANNSAKTWEESFAILCASQKAYDKGKKDALKEQKPAWSEEDEKMLNHIIGLLEGLPNLHNWLKSLKDRYTWKPSDEQIKALLYEVYAWDEDSINGQNLKSLYQDLKKLREE